MPTISKMKTDPHAPIVLDRYAERQNINTRHTLPALLVARCISKVMEREERPPRLVNTVL